MTTCIICGCSDEDACVDDVTGETCGWAELDLTGIEGRQPRELGVCTFCTSPGTPAHFPPPGPQLILPGDPEFHL